VTGVQTCALPICPKTAIHICKYKTNILNELIKNKDLTGLTTLGISVKIAKVIIDEFNIKNQIDSTGTDNYGLIKALKMLGYKNDEIEFAIERISNFNNVELSDLISQAIKIISNNNAL
jgi:Holliday junction resolvasome RuvABC DNA-binding subunit